MGTGTDGLYSLFTFLVAFVVMGLFSNKLYHNHTHKMIEKSLRMGITGEQQRSWLAKKGANKPGTLILILVLVLVLVLFLLLGVLTSITLPAYQEYVIRIQQGTPL